ncbi:MAG: hypothetical protein LC131_02925 [Anaerolineae bacterium]|jgi:hypothetical protein|nr:hypothetical protein [Anaerolineae bacterium]HNS38782.1 hypothetical protein [Promineifilum sp.]
MSNPSIVNTIAALVNVVRDVPGIVFAPDNPPSQIATTPAAVVWLTQGRATIGPPELSTHYHQVRIGLITGMGNIATADQVILPQVEPTIDAVFSALKNGDLPGIHNIAEITYTYGPIQWGDIWYFGAMIDLGEIKLQREL